MSDIFDLPRLSRIIGLPLLEMEDLKGPSIARGPVAEGPYTAKPVGEDEVYRWETIGCWGLLQTSQNNTEDEMGFGAGRLRMSSIPSNTHSS